MPEKYTLGISKSSSLMLDFIFKEILDVSTLCASCCLYAKCLSIADDADVPSHFIWLFIYQCLIVIHICYWLIQVMLDTCSFRNLTPAVKIRLTSFFVIRKVKGPVQIVNPHSP